MATTIRQLIEQLESEGDLDQPVFYQYILADHLDGWTTERLAKRLDEIEEAAGDNISQYMVSELEGNEDDAWYQEWADEQDEGDDE